MFHLQALILAEGRATQLQPEFSVVVTAKLYQFGRDGFAFISLSSIRWFATTSSALRCFCSTFHCRQEVAASSVVDIEIQSALHSTAFCTEEKLQFWNVASWDRKGCKADCPMEQLVQDEVLSGFNAFNGFNVESDQSKSFPGSRGCMILVADGRFGPRHSHTLTLAQPRVKEWYFRMMT